MFSFEVVQNFRSNSRPLNSGLENNALHIWIQNDLSFSKLFEICKSDVLWLLGHPNHYLSAHNISNCYQFSQYGKARFSNVIPVTQSNNLTRHIKTIHEGHKDYKCDSCGKSFVQPGVLRRHTITVYEGHKDFECDSCVKAFTEAGSLTRHIKTVHEHRKDFLGETCGKSFTDATKLRKHNKNVH